MESNGNNFKVYFLFSNFFSFLPWSFLGWHKQHIIRRIWLNHSKGCFLKVKCQNFDIFGFSKTDHFDKNFSKDDTEPLDKDGFYWIALKLIFQGFKGTCINLSLFPHFDTYCLFIPGGYFVLLLYICLLCDEVILPWHFRSPGCDVRGPLDPPNMIFFWGHILGLNFKISYHIASLFDKYIDMGERIAAKEYRPSLIIEDPLRAPK